MKKILVTLIALIMVSAIPCVAADIPFQMSNRENTFISSKLEYYQSRKDFAHTVAEDAREMGYLETDSIIQTAKEKWYEADGSYKYYKNFEKKFEEYPIATICWIYLKDLGYTDYVVAGIIGNMMVECGGLTLDLNPYIYAGYYGNYYGLCMWYAPYYPDICEMDTIGQLDYLASNIKYEVDAYGYFFYQGFNFDSLIKVNNVYDAAWGFGKAYERCGCEQCYPMRANCAYIAYEYFVG